MNRQSTTPRHRLGLLTALASGLTLAALVLMSGCASSTALGARSAEAASNPHVGAERIYRSRCIQCHALYPPASRTDAEWTRVMGDMETEANLSEADARAVLAYLQAHN